LKDKREEGILKITFHEKYGVLEIHVEDNGNDISDQEIQGLHELLNSEDIETETTALVNIHKRLKLSLGGESGLKFSRSPLGGLKVVLSIQTREGGHDV